MEFLGLTYLSLVVIANDNRYYQGLLLNWLLRSLHDDLRLLNHLRLLHELRLLRHLWLWLNEHITSLQALIQDLHLRLNLSEYHRLIVHLQLPILLSDFIDNHLKLLHNHLLADFANLRIH